MENEKDILDVLLGLPAREPKTQRIKMRELSRRAGRAMVFTVRELSYNEICDIQRMEGGRGDGGAELAVVLAGVVEPDLRNGELLRHYSAPTPAMLLPKLLSAGEIAELALRIERLSGYRRSVTEIVDDVKKNSTTETGAPS